METYRCLSKQGYQIDDYELIPIREEDIQFIRNWRNDQMDVLRQKHPITEKEQVNYYYNVIRKSFNQKNPEQILFSFLFKKKCIGYGGLVHIDWDPKRAEVSFLTETGRAKDQDLLQKDLRIFLKILFKVAFDGLKFNRLTTETFDIRPLIVKILEDSGFKQEGRLKDQVIIGGSYVNSLIHGFLRKDYLKINTNELMGNILVTSISRKVPLLKSLKKSSDKLNEIVKVIGADSNDNCIGKFFVDQFWHMPPIEQLEIKNLLEFCKKNKILCIIPTRDAELSYFAENKDLLQDNNIHVMISDPKAVKTCIDKLEFFEKGKELGFPIIQTTKKIDKLNCARYVVKEQVGAGSRKIGLNLKKDEAISHGNSLDNPIFQPFIDGKEFSVDLYVGKNGITKGVVTRTRELIVNGESQISETVRNSELEKTCSELVEKLKLYGHSVLQVIINSHGSLNIIECNNRFGGASSLSQEVGLDSFYWFLLESLGEKLDDYSFIRSSSDKKQIRHPEDLIV